MPNHQPDNAFEKGHEKNGGRKKGVPNKTTRILKEAIILAMEQIGEPRLQTFIVTLKDADGKPVLDSKGKPKKIKEQRLVYDGFDGLVGYLRWAALNNAPSVLACANKIIPTQVNVTSTQHREFRTVDDIRKEIESLGLPLDDHLFQTAKTIDENGNEVEVQSGRIIESTRTTVNARIEEVVEDIREHRPLKREPLE
jgi:hypothetical protein